MLPSVERSSDMGPLSLCPFCPGSIIATRGHDFREEQARLRCGQTFSMTAASRRRIPACDLAISCPPPTCRSGPATACMLAGDEGIVLRIFARVADAALAERELVLRIH
jgi:hypothetical protein